MNILEREERMREIMEEYKALEKEKIAEEKQQKLEEQKKFSKTLQKLFGCGSTTINHALDFTRDIKKIFPDKKEKEVIAEVKKCVASSSKLRDIYRAYGIKTEDEANNLMRHIMSQQQISYYKNISAGDKKPSGQQIGQTVQQATPGV